MIRFLTAGESHGPALLGILDGVPAGLPLVAESINTQLHRRQQGHGRGDRMKIYRDTVEILGGVRYGHTTGAPIGLMIRNADWENWKDKLSTEPPNYPTEPLTMPRPGHADYAGALKYRHTDIRNVIERSSARETAMRVAIGAICRELLSQFNIVVASHVVRIGDIFSNLETTLKPSAMNALADASPVRCLDEITATEMMREIDRCKQSGDTLGGEFAVHIAPVPVGLGSYVQADRRLDGILAGAILSIPAIKAVSIGNTATTSLKGSEFHDRIFPENSQRIKRITNRAGGIEGGITNGEEIFLRVTMKPLSSLGQPLESVDLSTGTPTVAIRERSDVCAVPAAAVVAENIISIELANVLLEKIGGDSLEEMKSHYKSWEDKWDTFSSQG